MTQRWTMLVLLLGFGMAGAAPARADCSSACDSRNCLNPTMSSSQQDICNNQVQECRQNCFKQQGNRRVYGAFAYGKQSTAWGYSYGKDSEDDAEKIALEGCQKNGNDCRIVYDFSNTCAALAAEEQQGAWVGAYATSRGQAENEALADCRSKYGNRCRLQVSACSLPY